MALLIALLVTTLLMALVVEFAYATRVSLRAAVNFRDSQRAYFLARSGVNFAGKLLAENLKNGKPRSDLVRREPDCNEPLPFVSTGDAALRVCWEDEAGKIQVTGVKTNPATRSMLGNLFENKGVDDAVLVRMTDPISDVQVLSLLDGLHLYMSDEEYDKVRGFLTVHMDRNAAQINVNSASVEVLRSLGISMDTAELIEKESKQTPYTDISNVPGIGTIKLNEINVSNYLITTSNTFKVHAYATVGGYTKVAEAVITRSTVGFTIRYWKIL